MNSSTASEETVRLERLRHEISNDIAAMQQKEAHLREYEQKLRALVEQASNSQPPLSYAASKAPVPAKVPAVGLDLEWEKFHRAQAQLEAARRGLTEERLALKDREEKAVLREQELARREAALKRREDELSGKTVAAPVPTMKASKPAFTTAPFIAAKNLLSLGKSH